MQATVKSVAASVHTNSTAYVTVGSAMMDGLSMWVGLGLDFYQAHWYDYMSSGNYCARCTDYATAKSTYGLDRPLVIGEFFGGASVDAFQRDQDFYNKGYAGGWAWSLFPGSTSDGMDVDLGASAAFSNLHSDAGPTAGSASSTPTPTATPTKTATVTATTTATATATASPTQKATATPTTPPVTANWSMSASTNKSSVNRGSSLNITANVTASAATAALVDIEVYDPAGNKVSQQAFDGQSFKAALAKSYTFGLKVPSNAARGTWTVKVGVFKVGWTGMLSWNDSAATFTVK